mmetsp:Transcript_24999/g.69464  ORF Transcript_24999/g.69464 Transcript_24999/m.69464 type:complete len:217 (-) Transcript_24999:140-790(-)
MYGTRACARYTLSTSIWHGYKSSHWVGVLVALRLDMILPAKSWDSSVRRILSVHSDVNEALLDAISHDGVARVDPHLQTVLGERSSRLVHHPDAIQVIVALAVRVDRILYGLADQSHDQVDPVQIEDLQFERLSAKPFSSDRILRVAPFRFYTFLEQGVLGHSSAILSDLLFALAIKEHFRWLGQIVEVLPKLLHGRELAQLLHILLPFCWILRGT